ncbi:MAG: InlB B-repeat-containing protein [Candidatus Aenigmatarchaeota archaeon]
MMITSVSSGLQGEADFTDDNDNEVETLREGENIRPSSPNLEESKETSKDLEIDGLADSPWPKFQQNLNNSGLSPHPTDHIDGREDWRHATGSRISSSPVIGSNDTIYVANTDGYIYALYPENGTEKWDYRTDNEAEIRSSPAIGENETIYFSDRGGYLHAIHPNGTEAWDQPYEAEDDIEYSSPSIGKDGTIYFGDRSGYLHAVYSENGTRRWAYRTDNEAEIRSSPAIGENGTIYFGDRGGYLHAIHPNGTEAWDQPYEAEDNIEYSSPSIAENGTIYIGDRDGFLHAVHPNGTENWMYETGNDIESSPAIGESGTIYIGDRDGLLHAVHPNGTEKWTYDLQNEIRSSPVIGENGMIYAGDRGRDLHAVRPDGTEKWVFHTENTIDYSSPAIGELGNIYVGDIDGYIYNIGGRLNLTINSTSGGIVVEPGEGSFEYNYTTEVNLTAYIREGYEFVRWTGDNETIDDPSSIETTITMEDDYNITAEFAKKTYELEVKSTEGGYIEEPGENVFEFEHGDEVEIKAVSEENYFFEGWMGDNDTIEDPSAKHTTVKMLDDYAITAAFSGHTRTLTVNSTEGGNVTEPGEKTIECEYGEVVDITAEADKNYRFVEWMGDNDTIADTTADRTTIEMMGNYSIKAQFTKYSHSLKLFSSEGGEIIEPGEGSHEVEQGEQINLEAAASEGYYFVEWRGDNETVTETTSKQTTIHITGNSTLMADFAPKTYELTVEQSEGGEIIKPGEGDFEYEHGTEIVLEAVSDQSYSFKGWTGDNDTIVEPNSRMTTIEMMEDYTISAEFEEITADYYGLTVYTEGEGEVEIKPDQEEYEEGTEVTLSAVPADDWQFSHWEGDVPEGEENEEISIIMDTDKDITAHFVSQAEMVELTIDSTEGGNVTEPGEGTFEYKENEIVNLEADAEEGYQFVEWTGDTDEMENPNTGETNITMNDNYTITAQFEEEGEKDTYRLTVNTEGEGTIELDPEQDEYEEGTEVTLTANLEEGWTFSHWEGDVPEGESENRAITLEMDEEKTVTAHFEKEDEEGIISLSRGIWLTIGILALLIAIILILVLLYPRKEAKVVVKAPGDRMKVEKKKTYTYPFEVENQGGAEETYSLKAASSADGWAVKTLKEVTIPSESEKSVPVEVTLPGSAKPGDTAEMMLKATSQDDTDVTDFDKLEVSYQPPKTRQKLEKKEKPEPEKVTEKTPPPPKPDEFMKEEEEKEKSSKEESPEEEAEEFTKEESVEELTRLEGVGTSTAEILFENGYRSVEDVKKAEAQELRNIKGIGPTLSDMIKESAEELED